LKQVTIAFWQSLKELSKPTKPASIALALGAISVLAFAPFSFSPVILFTIAGLFLLWQDSETAFDSVKLGLWFGMGMFGVGVSWLFSSMYFYSGVALPFSILLTFGFVLFLALSTALSGWMAFYFKNPNRIVINLVLLFPAVWVVGELFRATIFGGFPFLLSGVSHLHTWLDGYAPIFGVWGVSWAIAISAGLLVWLFRSKNWLAASITLCLLWSVGGLLKDVEWVKPLDNPIDVALIQANIPQEEKWQREAFFPTLQKYIIHTKNNMDADVIVWPETAVPAYYDVVERGALLQFIKDAQILNTDIVIGVIDGDIGVDNYYNALINVRNPEDRYYKHHLVPFSEYFPFTSAFEFLTGLFNIPFATFSAGDPNQKPMKLGGHDVSLSICFEMAFGEELATQLPEAKYMITVSNDAWFANTFQPAQQLQDVQMRALELGREVARSTNTGYTAIIDIKGNIKYEIAPYQEGVLRGKVQPYEGLTFYAQWKRLPVLFLLFMFFGFLLAKRYLLKGRLAESN